MFEDDDEFPPSADLNSPVGDLGTLSVQSPSRHECGGSHSPQSLVHVASSPCKLEQIPILNTDVEVAPAADRVVSDSLSMSIALRDTTQLLGATSLACDASLPVSEPALTADDILRNVSQLPSENLGRLGLGNNSHAWQSGAWSFDGRTGLRSNTRAHGRLTSLVCRFIHALLPAFSFTAFAILQNIKVENHVDHDSRSQSLHLLIPLSSFQGGSVRVDEDGASAVLRVADGPVLLDPSRPHSVEEWTGHRAVLVAFSPDGFEKLSQPDQELLVSLGFRPPAPQGDSFGVGPVSSAFVTRAAEEQCAACVPAVPDQVPSSVPASGFAADVADRAQSRLFLDLCSGSSAPLSSALSAQGVCCLPLDVLIDQGQNLLADSFYEDVLRLAFSGIVAYGHASPPCCEYTLLKQMPGGPPPCRSVEHMDGLPDNTPDMCTKVRDSRTLMQRSAQILRAVFQGGGHVSLEQPRNSLAWREPFVQAFLSDLQVDLVVIPACRYGLDAYKHWLFAGTWRPIQEMQGQCTHAQGTHPSFAGVHDGHGNFASRATAMFPKAMAEHFCRLVLPLFAPCSLNCEAAGSLLTLPQAMRLLPVRELNDFPRATQDGGGMNMQRFVLPALPSPLGRCTY